MANANTGLLRSVASMDRSRLNASFRGSPRALTSSKASLLEFKKQQGRMTMQSLRYEEDEFQLIPYYPYKNNKERYLYSYLPILYWLPRYRWKEYFVYDLIAASTAIVMVVPQSMGYALIAGLPAINGLYSALFGHSLYSFFGTSGQLIIAPVAIVSLMVEETLMRLPGIMEGPDATERYVAYASCLAFQVGAIALVLGLMNAGVFANMLAEPVIVGFTFAAAILIGMSQLKYLFQITLEGEELIINMISFVENVPNIHGPSAALAAICLTVLLLHKFGKDTKRFAWLKFVPVALFVVIIVTMISSQINVGWDIIGDDVYNGFPKFDNFFYKIDGPTFWALWVNSLLITIIAYIETIAVATKFAEKHDYQVNASQELIALGVANSIGCWFGIYPVAGVLSLAAVVEQAGALTPLYTAMAGFGIIIVTSFFITLFKYLPKPVLGSIVCVGVLNLCDIPKIKAIWRVSKNDFLVLCCTVLMTLIIGIDYGVLVGIVGSLLMFIYSSTRPEYGRIGKTDTNNYMYHDEEDPSKAKVDNDMLILRWDQVLFFGNAQLFKDRVKMDMMSFLAREEHPERFMIRDWALVLCFDSINQIDFTAIDALHSLFKEIKHKYPECIMLITNLHHNIYQLLEKAHLIEVIGKNHIHLSIADAEAWYHKHQQKGNIQTRDQKKPQMQQMVTTVTTK
eukprot:8724_1